MDILVYIEISKNSTIKYEFDPELNTLICDRVLYTPFAFPFNYGFIPNTLSGDGDPIDAIVYMDQPLVPGCHIKCRIIGCLETEDEKGEDAKLILVPVDKVCPETREIKDVTDLPSMFIEKVIYFYQHYKDIEKKQVTIGKLLNKDDSILIYNKSIICHKKNEN